MASPLQNKTLLAQTNKALPDETPTRIFEFESSQELWFWKPTSYL